MKYWNEAKKELQDTPVVLEAPETPDKDADEDTQEEQKKTNKRK